MNTKTRIFLMVSGGVLVLGVGTGVVASYLGLSAIALGGPDGPAELKYLPPDARLVAFANVRELMASEFRHQLMKQPGALAHKSDELQTLTGINPEIDIDSVVVGVAGSPGDSRQRALVLARGRFDTVKIEHAIRERGGIASDYKGKRVLEQANPGAAQTGLALAFMEPGLLVFGALAGVRQAIDLSAGGANITTNDDVMGLVRGIESGNAWVVGRFDALTARANLTREMANRLPAITWFSASGRFEGGVEGLVRAEARDEAAAGNLRDVIQGLMALGRLQAGGRSAATAVINSLQLGGQGKTVSLKFSIPAASIAALASELPRPRAADRDAQPHGQPRNAP